MIYTRRHHRCTLAHAAFGLLSLILIALPRSASAQNATSGAIRGRITGLFGLTPNVRWGEFGHRLIAEIAVDAMPAEMPAFFRPARAQLMYLNPEPDRWRERAEASSDPALDGGPASDHYINLERLPTPRRAGILASATRVAYNDSLKALGEQPGDGHAPLPHHRAHTLETSAEASSSR